MILKDLKIDIKPGVNFSTNEDVIKAKLDGFVVIKRDDNFYYVRVSV